MKLYSTYSNNPRDGIYRVCITKLKIVRWDDEPLRVTECDTDIWEHAKVLKGTVAPKNWILR